MDTERGRIDDAAAPKESIILGVRTHTPLIVGVSSPLIVGVSSRGPVRTPINTESPNVSCERINSRISLGIYKVSLADGVSVSRRDKNSAILS
jgi:hypothetical protein